MVWWIPWLAVPQVAASVCATMYEHKDQAMGDNNADPPGKLLGYTVEQCKQACCDSQTLYGFVCKSFDYKQDGSWCYLSPVASGDPGTTMVSSSNYHYWSYTAFHINWVGNGASTLSPCGGNEAVLIRPRLDLTLCLRVAPPFTSTPASTELASEGSGMIYSSQCDDAYSHHRFQATLMDSGSNKVEGRRVSRLTTEANGAFACLGETPTTATAITTTGTATRIRSCSNVRPDGTLEPTDLVGWYVFAGSDGGGFYLASREHRNQNAGYDSCMESASGVSVAPTDGDALVYGGPAACATAPFFPIQQFVLECIPSPPSVPPPIAPSPSAPSAYITLNDPTVERCEQRGFMSITDRTECTEQVHALYNPSAVDGDLVASNTAWPYGCFYHVDNHKAWLHLGAGTGNSPARLVCKRPEAVDITTHCGVCKTHIYLSDYASNIRPLRHSPTGTEGGTTGRPFLLSRGTSAFTTASPVQANPVTRAVSTIQNDVYQLAFARAGSDPTAAHFAAYESYMRDNVGGQLDVTQTPGSNVRSDWFVYSTSATPDADVFLVSRGTGKCVRPDMASTTVAVLNTESGGAMPFIDTAVCDYSAGANPQRWNLKCEVRASHSTNTNRLPPR